MKKKAGGGRSEEVAKTMYTHVSKCKHDKIKERKKINNKKKKEIHMGSCRQRKNQTQDPIYSTGKKRKKFHVCK
jgi:hypothetical protein